MDSHLEKLNKKYLLLMKKAHEIAGRKEAVSIICHATKLAQEIASIEKKTWISNV